MPEYLVFRLYGPMAAWGGAAPGEFRPSESRPSRSGVFGLVAAALGIRREDTAAHRHLHEGYRMATLVSSPGTLVRDFHTVQTPSRLTKKRAWPFATRREEVSVSRNDLGTIVSTREYFCDALYTACIWPAVETPPYSLTEIADALRSPVFVPYLGRKSCPLALPISPQIVCADDLHMAFADAEFSNRDVLGGLSRKVRGMLFWEGDEDTGFEMQGVQSVPRRDVPLNKKPWTFSKRIEHEAMVVLPEGVQ